MPFSRRLLVIAILMAVALTAYGIAKHYSASLVAYVVEQGLLQKLPPGVNPEVVRMRFHGLLTAMPDRGARLERLLIMSQYLEKVQILTVQELDELLGKDRSTPRSAAFMKFVELLPRAIV